MKNRWWIKEGDWRNEIPGTGEWVTCGQKSNAQGGPVVQWTTRLTTDQKIQEKQHLLGLTEGGNSEVEEFWDGGKPEEGVLVREPWPLQ